MQAIFFNLFYFKRTLIQFGNTSWDFPTFKEGVHRRKKTRDKTMVATINTAMKVNRAKKQFKGEDKEKFLKE